VSVFRHSTDTVGRTRDALRHHLSPAALERIGPELEDGLAVYLYYYPSVPTRARDVEYLLDGLDFRARTFKLVAEVCDPEGVIRLWVRGFVRMLYLGYLPGSLASFRTGICCQPQNACLNGGFVDLDSLTPIAELRDDTAVFAALQFSVDALIRTVRTLVAGSSDGTRGESTDNAVDVHYLSRYVSSLVEQSFETEVRPGLELDPRIARYFAPPRTYAELVDRLCTYYSPQTAFAGPNRLFGKFGLSLLRRTLRTTS